MALPALAVNQFTFENHEVRTIILDGEPWFVVVDVCNALKLTNPAESVRKLDDDEKGISLIDTLGGKQEMCVISESGMYTLVLRCRDAVKPGTLPHRFRKWVTSEVLPQIRKTGSYESSRKEKKTTVDERTPLRDAVNMLVSKKHLMYPEAYAIIHQRFNVESIEDLATEQLPMAVEYVHRLVLEGEFLGKQEALPAPALTLNYGMDWFEQYRWIIGSAALDAPWRYPAEMLNPNGDYPNPIGRMLTDLKNAGQQVDAAMFQLQALQHHLWVCRQKISRASLTLQ